MKTAAYIFLLITAMQPDTYTQSISMNDDGNPLNPNAITKGNNNIETKKKLFALFAKMTSLHKKLLLNITMLKHF